MCVCVEYQNIHENSRKMDSREKFWNSFPTKLLLQLLDSFENRCFVLVQEDCITVVHRVLPKKTDDN